MKFSFLLLFAISSTAFARGPAGTFRDVYGPEFHRQPSASSNKNPNVASDVLHRWNRIAIDATGLDHTPVAPGENRVFGEQLGPGRASRAMAIVHIAIFDAINAILGGYQSYTGIDSAPHPVSTGQPSHRRRMTLLFPFIRRKRPPLTRNWRTTFCASLATSRKAMVSHLANKSPPRYWPRALPMAPKYRSFISASTISQATFLVTGGRIQSA